MRARQEQSTAARLTYLGSDHHASQQHEAPAVDTERQLVLPTLEQALQKDQAVDGALLPSAQVSERILTRARDAAVTGTVQYGKVRCDAVRCPATSGGARPAQLPSVRTGSIWVFS